jgi:hypothetical protein
LLGGGAETVHDFLVFDFTDEEFHVASVETVGEFAGIDVFYDMFCDEFVVEDGAEGGGFEGAEGGEDGGAGDCAEVSEFGGGGEGEIDV